MKKQNIILAARLCGSSPNGRVRPQADVLWRTILFATAYSFSLHIESFGQGVWTKKTDFGGGNRSYGVGFSIGTKGYIGTGNDGVRKKDFWEWDQVTNTWTQKADFNGTVRYWATGFSIGNKGYIGTGHDGVSYRQDFWEWDGNISSPTYNTWTQKLDFGGTARACAVGFSIGTKGYIGTGFDINFTNKQDFWEWDGDVSSPTYNTWTQKNNFAGTARYAAIGFSIGTKGYIGTGLDGNNLFKDFWEWDQVTNIWTKKADFGGIARNRATGFSIGTKGYIGTGTGEQPTPPFDPVYFQDFWEYDPGTNNWMQKANFGGTVREVAVGFSIGAKGYIGTGTDGTSNYQDFWEYDSNALTSINEDNIETSVSVYPNPFSIQVTFSLSKEVSNALFIVYDISGKEMIKQINFSGKQITAERENLPSGTYFYQIISEDNPVSSGKLIIQ